MPLFIKFSLLLFLINYGVVAQQTIHVRFFCEGQKIDLSQPFIKQVPENKKVYIHFFDAGGNELPIENYSFNCDAQIIRKGQLAYILHMRHNKQKDTNWMIIDKFFRQVLIDGAKISFIVYNIKMTGENQEIKTVPQFYIGIN